MESHFPGIWRARGSSHLVIPGQKKAPAPVPNNADMELFQNAYLQGQAPEMATPRKRTRKRKKKPSAQPCADTNSINTADPSIDSCSSSIEEPADRGSIFDCED